MRYWNHSKLASITALGDARRLVILVAVLLLLPVSALASDLLRQRLVELQEQAKPSLAEVRLASPKLLNEAYAARGYAFAWINPGQVSDFKVLAERSSDLGLRPADFHIPELDKLLPGGDPAALKGQERVDVEILLSDGLLRLIHHSRYGKVDPRVIDKNWNHDDGPKGEALAADLGRVLAAPNIKAAVTALRQEPGFYSRLKEGLVRYRALAAAGGWPTIPSGPKLEPGMHDGRVSIIRERLRITGDYQGSVSNSGNFYGPELEKAVRHFQERHSLEVDGRIGRATLAAMNVSAEERVAQIRVNLERMRWVGDKLPKDYLLVDIAAQRVELHRDGQDVWQSKAIVGRPERPTPIFRDRIEYLEFNPTWTVPPTILKEDVVPKARQNPNAVRKKGLEIIDRRGNKVEPETVDWSVSPNNLPYTFRQPPGPKNALGQVKFMFPNRHSVYLHDTSDRQLFQRTNRTLSSGCVRVDKPIELAELLLNDPKWNKEKFDSVFESKRPSSVRLKQPLPVILSYWTAEADDQGQVHFRSDFYGQDQPVLAALDGPGAGLRLYRPVQAEAPAKDQNAMPEAEAKDWMAGPPPAEDAGKEGQVSNQESKKATPTGPKPTASPPKVKSAAPGSIKPAPKLRESLAGASAKAS
ncbi:MAG: L,D-transpeptidase family protein [Chromatiaceae bacterium]